MKISGIICEYNPFHNGHLYHVRETRKNGATHIVSVMSGNFVQRGDTAIMDKLDAIQIEQAEIKNQLVSVMRLTVTMAEELESKGKVNGGTNAELSKLKEQLYNK